MAGDIFAQFARMADNREKDSLVIPEPVPYVHRSCVLEAGDEKPCKEIVRPNTPQEVKAALQELRQHFQPYLADYAPSVSSVRRRISISEFLLDGEPITIPHYGGPLGDAVQSYTSEFELSDFEGKSVWFCCGGADYIATVYINDRCVGIHEGFFAPFDFEITRYVVSGINKLEIVLENDFPMRGIGRKGEADPVRFYGDKIYAATGLGYDDPEAGWHHCPPGMGLYHSVSIEVRENSHITDLFVQPDIKNGTAVVWIEAENTTYEELHVEFCLSLYGQNFSQTVFEGMRIQPEFMGKPMLLQHGRHVYKITVEIPDARWWEPETPWLYQMQVSMMLQDKVCDTAVKQFGMRSFTQDLESNPKGRFFLNGKPIRLRGANTMGFEQQDVMKGDYDQLIDDILLAKLCNMNFWRITQRPVQDEVYQYCDRLGLMTQCDFPLFGVMRRSKEGEAMRQVEEMIRLVRNHPSNVVVTYINEPWQNAKKEPHRYLLRNEMEDLFEIFDRIIHAHHPDCVIKHVDGDFDPPTRDTMPDIHCYTLWYNGGQQDFGLLHRGYGQPVAPGWCYGCGEYGAEGLDFPDVMRECYPSEWVQEPFDPHNIIAAQAGDWHGCFMDTPDTMEEWCEATQAHQAFAMKVMTEAYRRDPRVVSTALHLFIDAWPSGWMKAIMDCRRTPKAAWYTSRDALEPLMLSLRSDRFTFYAGEQVSIETYICNDTTLPAAEGSKLVFQLYGENGMCMHGEIEADYEACAPVCAANVEFVAPAVEERGEFTLKAFLLSPDGTTLADQTFTFTVFADVEVSQNEDTVWITELENGTHEIAGEMVTVENCPHRATYFLSRKTAHPAITEFRPDDFRMWYDKDLDRLSPIASQCFSGQGFRPVLICNGSKDPRIVVGEKIHEGKRYIICLAKLREENPVARRLRRNLNLMNVIE